MTNSSKRGACQASSAAAFTTATASDAALSCDATLPKCSVIVIPGASTTAMGRTFEARDTGTASSSRAPLATPLPMGPHAPIVLKSLLRTVK
eukprot:CAMPEP_0181184788 /NCGR_PEP_ID=MMETSP1096-20121128/9156_1 /TAXON_ID=156174 ORGANISM="Chrysochromulina ericina, Strain CCMP281" /NCGR_SAMPLE_ID=MMETSP1096 /ASSEMBLY_ACC=CAM_ASM_000453 /LENGTH=91 /DNA_ID=CAMNT_0023273579 /DNA_START=1045 /DNA_END=1317 /DNA_ORIENTATION=-